MKAILYPHEGYFNLPRNYTSDDSLPVGILLVSKIQKAESCDMFTVLEVKQYSRKYLAFALTCRLKTAVQSLNLSTN